MCIQEFEAFCWKIHKFSSYLTLKICGMDFSNSASFIKTDCSMSCQVFLDKTWSYLISKNLFQIQPFFILVSTTFLIFDHFPWFPLSTFSNEKFHGMNSYEVESSSIEKYEFWRIFFIYIILPYLFYFQRYLQICFKKSPSSQLYSDASYVWSKHTHLFFKNMTFLIVW